MIRQGQVLLAMWPHLFPEFLLGSLNCALAAVGPSCPNEVGSPAMQNPQLRRAYAASEATNAHRAHYWRQRESRWSMGQAEGCGAVL